MTWNTDESFRDTVSRLRGQSPEQVIADLKNQPDTQAIVNAYRTQHKDETPTPDRIIDWILNWESPEELTPMARKLVLLGRTKGFARSLKTLFSPSQKPEEEGEEDG